MDLSEITASDVYIVFADDYMMIPKDRLCVPIRNGQNHNQVISAIENAVKEKRRMFIDCSRSGYRYYVTNVVPHLDSSVIQKGYALYKDGSPGIIN